MSARPFLSYSAFIAVVSTKVLSTGEASQGEIYTNITGGRSCNYLFTYN